MTVTAPTTCTVVTSNAGGRCNAPAVSSWTSSRGDTYHECANHDTSASFAAPVVDAPAHPPTRTTQPFVLVADGVIVGYAAAITPASRRRAVRLGATIVPVRR